MKPSNSAVFDERAHLIAVAGLLHDAGKVLQPAAMPLEPQTSNLRQMICPSDFRTGQATHLHVLYTAAAFDLAVSNFGGLDREELFRVACYHHRPSTDSLDQNILTKADWLASGHDRRSATEPADSITALAPVLAGVEWPEQARSSEGLGLPAKLLSLDEDSFLPGAEQSRDEYRDRCRELTGRLVEGLKQDFRNPTECVDGLLGLTERVFHSIPASRDRKQQPDVTLFDHSRIVAAFATCLAKQFSGARRPASELQGQFRLVAISLGGIQKFLFRVVTPLDERDGEQARDAGGLTGARGMARRLRACSLYMGRLSWLAARRVHEDVGLPSTNLIANAGGGEQVFEQCSASCSLLTGVPSMSDVRTIRVFSASPGDLVVERPGVGWDQLARTHLGHPQRVTGDPTLTRRCESSGERRPTGELDSLNQQRHFDAIADRSKLRSADFGKAEQTNSHRRVVAE